MQSYPSPPFLNYRNSSTVLKLSNSQANLPKNRKFVTARPLHWIFALLSFSSALFLLFNKSSVLSGIAFFYDHYVEIKYIIGPGEVRLFSFLILLSAVLLILVGIIFLISRNRELWGKIRTAFLRDDWGQIQAGLLKPKNTFVLSSIFSVAIAALHSFQRLWNTEFLFREDGLFESLTVILFLLSSVFLAYSLYLKTGSWFPFQGAGRAAKLQLIIVFFFIFAGLEEISWGQRIFAWSTPASMSLLNMQNETNIHNIFNPYNTQIYGFLTIYFLFIWVLGWIFYRPKNNSLYVNVFPHLNLLLLMLIIVLAAILGRNELVEILASIFALFYSLRVLVATFPKTVTDEEFSHGHLHSLAHHH